MTKKAAFFIIIALLLIAVILLAAWLAVSIGREGKSGESAYSAVYLVTGDIYFGKLTLFPRPHLRNVWFIQRGVDQQNQPQLGVAALKNAFWGPVDEIYLNPKNIVFWTKLRSDSQLAKALDNPESVGPLTGPQTQSGAGNLPSATSTIKK